MFGNFRKNDQNKIDILKSTMVLELLGGNILFCYLTAAVACFIDESFSYNINKLTGTLLNI